MPNLSGRIQFESKTIEHTARIKLVTAQLKSRGTNGRNNANPFPTMFNPRYALHAAGDGQNQNHKLTLTQSADLLLEPHRKENPVNQPAEFAFPADHRALCKPVCIAVER